MKKHKRFIEAHPGVKAWLCNRPEQTRRNFASHLQKFCEAINMTPEEWRHLDRFEARDLAWKYIEPKIKDHPSVAKADLVALKSWFRNLNGEMLPLDSGRGGKHHLRVNHPKQAVEHIPNKKEMYQIVDMASSLRDKSILLLLFQSGVRVNVLEHLTYGDVQDQLGQEVITLKITGHLDYKLRSRDIPFYYTFLNGEASETLKRFCEVHHKNSKRDTPLFATSGHKHVNQRWIWTIVKMCVKRAGFEPGTITTHTLRKAFRKIVRQAPIDDDDKEQLMGHVISGSRQAYYDKKDIELIKEAYLKCNFVRGVGRVSMEVSELKAENLDLKSRLHRVELEITELKKTLEKLLI